MLIAKNEKKERINLLEYSKASLSRLKTQKFYCCACSGDLILKSGTIRQVHFAHKSRLFCQSFAEGETVEHLAGKSLIVEWCQKFNVSYRLEAYLPQLKQRPDVLIEEHWAIEFQCSGLSLERFIERTKNYQEQGYNVIWIVGKNFFIKNKMTEQQRRFLYYHQNIGFYYWELSVAEEEIRLHTFIEEISCGQGLLTHCKKWSLRQKKPLEVLRYPEKAQLFVFRQHEWAKVTHEYLNQLKRRLHHKEKKIMELQAELYQHKQHLEGLDLIHFSLIQRPLYSRLEPIKWSLVFWSIVAEMRTSKISRWQIEKKLQEKIENQEMGLFNLPCVSPEIYALDFLNRYISLLEQLNYVEINEEMMIIKQFPLYFEQLTDRQKYFLEKFKELSRFTATPLKNVIK